MTINSKVILCIDFFTNTIKNKKLSEEEIGKYNYMIHNILQISDLVYVDGKFFTTDEFKAMA